eukprot:TRINITY_DN34581_c0_g1_i1.p1 TRINITY_DN34581_c0_g1~~TRINITY_DN34581_c0_g1_i1.p1  ORF type:complete len:271 (+),score=47.17 TRINITY_DN34581_c0_g1_i1:654-1466(+)
MAAYRAKLTGTFVNIGAGTCMPPDPLYQLLASPEGYAMVGLAVDANLEDLLKCKNSMKEAPATVLPVHLEVDPLSIAQKLRPWLELIFSESPSESLWPLDFLVVDIDGCDCLVVEELLRLVQPKVLQMELAFHIPPPFRFTLQWHAGRSPEWNQQYDVSKLNPVTGCSLSYALHKLRPFGYHLLRITPGDAVFVHDSVIPMMEHGLNMRFPQDEFLCYRDSTLWMQMPGAYVREWFFARHPALAFGNLWDNLTLLSREVGRAEAPFTLDF